MGISQGILVIFLVVLGAIARTVLPYLIMLREKPETSFDRKYFVPLIASVLITLLTVPLAFAAIPDQTLSAPLNVASGLALFLAGYGFNSLTRDVQRAGEGVNHA